MKYILATIAVLFLALILWAISVGNFGEAGRFLTTKPWGIVTLVDLYIGFILSGIVIFLTERDKRTALAWILPIFVLGNLVTASWFAVRGLNLLRQSLERFR